MTPPELRALLARGRRGDDAAFERLVEATRERLFRKARRLLDREALAEEVLQEAYVALWGSTGPVPESPEAWLTTAVVHGALDHLRRHEHRTAAPWTAAEEAPAPSADPMEAAASWQVVEAVEGLLDRLPSGERRVFVLRAFEGWTFEEIADRTGTAGSTVRNQFQSARRRLAGWLSERGVRP